MSNESKKVETKGAEKNKRSFFKDFKAEIKKVIWPTPKQLVNNTVAVISIVLITSALVFILDFVFETANKYGVEKLKSALGISFETEEHDNDHDHEDEENSGNEVEESENTINNTNTVVDGSENTNTQSQE